MPHHRCADTPTVVSADLLKGWPLPPPGQDKHDRGTVVVVGGAARTPGAALLAGLAALRAGAGQLRVAVAGSVAPALALAVPEALVAPLPFDERSGSIEPMAAEVVAELMEGADCLCLGPGLDDPDRTSRLVRAVLTNLPDGIGAVADAFALGVLPAMVAQVEAIGSRVLLTPNADEAQRLLPDGSAAPTEDREAMARLITARYSSTVTLRGCTSEPGGALYVDRTGSAGLGTSGSGDVLAGLAAGLIARGAHPAQAAVWAVHLHALAGHRLAQRLGPLGYLARELLDEIPSLLEEFSG